MDGNNMSTTVRTVTDLVKAFGGTKVLADWCDIGMSAVSNWQKIGAIPPGYHHRLANEMKRRGIPYDECVFEAQCIWPDVRRSQNDTAAA